MRHIILSCLIFVILGQSGLSAELTWPECVEIAKAHNPDLLIAQEKVHQTELQYSSVESGTKPQVSAGLGLQQSGTDKEDSNVKSQSASLGAKQVLYDGTIGKNLDISNEKIKDQKYNLAIAEANVRLSLRQNFCETLRLQKILALAKTTTTRRKDQFELVKLRYGSGLEHKGALLTAQANFTRALNEVAQAERNLELSKKRLALTLGTTNNIAGVTATVTLATEIKNTPEFTSLIQESPLLKNAVSQRLQSNLGVALSQANYLPTAYLSGSLGKSKQETATAINEGSSWSVGANLAFNIYDGNRNGLNESIAHSQLKQSELSLAKSQQNIELALSGAWRDLLNNAEAIQVAQEFLNAAEERSTIASAQYASGLITFDNWIIIENDLVSAQKQFVNSNIDALVAEANWSNAKGETL